MSTMNSTSLYVTTNQIVLKSNPSEPSTWHDLYRLLPYLRNSLCCVVCGSLLVSPLTPSAGKCQHHLCKDCTGGKKKIKPACPWCKDCESYIENKQLRTLLQCYKSMCSYLLSSSIYKTLVDTSEITQSSGVERGAGNLLLLIREGAMFQDDYKSTAGLSKDVYSILPCVYTNSSTQTLQNVEANKMVINQKNTNGSPMYSVMYTGTGNKITIKRKSKEATTLEKPIKKEPCEKNVFKKPVNKCSVKLRRGCRCGNATATPGKLTCCGQRCPCYVESKACVDCKCRGCRNPHTPDGNKVLNMSHVAPPPSYQDCTNGANVPVTNLPAVPKPQQAQFFPKSVHPDGMTFSDQVQGHQYHPQESMFPQVKIELDANLTLAQLSEQFSLESSALPFS